MFVECLGHVCACLWVCALALRWHVPLSLVVYVGGRRYAVKDSQAEDMFFIDSYVCGVGGTRYGLDALDTDSRVCVCSRRQKIWSS